MSLRLCLSMMVLLLAVLYLITMVAGESVNTAECIKLGFAAETACSDCNLMEEYVKDAELVLDCKKCCTADQKASKYTHARLEVCPYRLNGLPQIQAFLEKTAKSFKNLKVVKQFQAYPRIVLYNKGSSSSSGSGTLSIRVDNWKASAVEEYLNSMLVSSTT